MAQSDAVQHDVLLAHSEVLIRLSTLLRRDGSEWEWVGCLCKGSKSVFVEEVKELFYLTLSQRSNQVQLDVSAR